MTNDLDALLAELDQEGPKVTLFGEEWTLPADVDAETMLRMERMTYRVLLAHKSGKPLDPATVLDDAVTVNDLVRELAGEENLHEWLRRGLKYKQLTTVARTLYAIHNGEQEPGKGGSGGPVKPTRTRTGSGQSGKRTR